MSRLTLQIATLGLYANERIRYVTTRRPVDKIYLIYTEMNRPDVEAIVEQYRREGVPVSCTCVEPWSYAGILAEVLDVIHDHAFSNF